MNIHTRKIDFWFKKTFRSPVFGPHTGIRMSQLYAYECRSCMTTNIARTTNVVDDYEFRSYMDRNVRPKLSNVPFFVDNMEIPNVREKCGYQRISRMSRLSGLHVFLGLFGTPDFFRCPVLFFFVRISYLSRTPRYPRILRVSLFFRIT